MLSLLLKEREWTIPFVLVRVFGILSFTLATALGAYVYIPLPFTPVPITLQVFFVLLSGLYLGPYYGFTSQSIYLLLGIAGVPLFAAGKAGFQTFFGPTGGYLLAFPVTALLLGKIFTFSLSKLKRILLFLFSLFIIYAFGLTGLALFFSFEKSLYYLILIGVLPFLPGDFLKIILLYFCSFYTKRAREILAL